MQSKPLANISYLYFAQGPKHLRRLAGEAETLLYSFCTVRTKIYSSLQALHCGEMFSPVIADTLAIGHCLLGSLKAGAAENKRTLINK